MDTNKTNEEQRNLNDPKRNPDPITKAPGSHPVGTGIGAAAGGAAGVGAAIAAGAAMGTVVGPVGTAVGAVVGAVAGGLVGKGAAEGVNPTVEHEYWRKNYATRDYVKSGASYDDYGPAYQYGWQGRERYAGKKFDDVENDLERDWERNRGNSKISWDEAKRASRDAWDRVDSQHEDEGSD